jgi:hypothetical protein
VGFVKPEKTIFMKKKEIKKAEKNTKVSSKTVKTLTDFIKANNKNLGDLKKEAKKTITHVKKTAKKPIVSTDRVLNLSITATFSSNGELNIDFQVPEKMGFLEAIGILESAKYSLLARK